jgi:hypothetical protein
MTAADHDHVKARVHWEIPELKSFYRRSPARSKAAHLADSPMFHVKHLGSEFLGLLSNAEIAENDVKNVFDIHPAGQSAQGPTRQAKLLGDDFLPCRGGLAQGAIQRRYDILKGPPVSLPGHQRRLGRPKVLTRMLRKRRQKLAES